MKDFDNASGRKKPMSVTGSDFRTLDNAIQRAAMVQVMDSAILA